MPILRNILASFSPRDRLAQRLYDQCVAASRDVEHYGPGRIADTVDGRFDMLVLHLFVVAHRLGGISPGGDAMMRSLTEAFIRDMDRNLREMGAGDIGVAKRIKYMGQAMHGQIQAFGRAMDEGPEALRDTLARTVLSRSGADGEASAVDNSGRDGQDVARGGEGTDGSGTIGSDEAARLAAYVQAQVRALAAQPDADCLAASCRLLPVSEAYGLAETEAV